MHRRRASPAPSRRGLVCADGSRKPAFTALARLIALAGGRLKPTSPVATSGPAPRFRVTASRADSSRLIGIWALAAGPKTTPHDLSGVTVTLTAGAPLLVIDGVLPIRSAPR